MKKIIKNYVYTLIIIILAIAIFIGINIYINTLNLAPIDFTKEKLNILSEESINQVKKVDSDVHIYFFGYEDSDKTVSLAKQYNIANNKIDAEAIDIAKRPDLAQKYGVDNKESTGIIIEGKDNRYKVLTPNDFYTYDNDTYEAIDITESKLFV